VLRPATPDDVDDIRKWRNHSDVRSVSLTTHHIGVEEHVAWFAAATTDPTRRVLIFEHAGVPSGVVNFTDVRDGHGAWGFFLDVDGLADRDEMLPAWLRIGVETIAYAFDDLGLDELTGEVLAHNIVVRQMNRRLGFTETGSRPVVIDGAQVQSLSIRLRRADRRTGSRRRVAVR
jgi:RimJ/RimL family protein N-acetyltransferase